MTLCHLKMLTPLLIDGDNTGIFHRSEMWIGLKEFDHRLLTQRERPENSGLNESNPDLCDAGAELQQFSTSGSRSLCGWIIHSFILYNLHFRYMENSCNIIIYLHIYGLIIDPHNDLLPFGLKAQLSEHCTGITEVIIRIPVYV